MRLEPIKAAISRIPHSRPLRIAGMLIVGASLFMALALVAEALKHPGLVGSLGVKLWGFMWLHTAWLSGAIPLMGLIVGISLVSGRWRRGLNLLIGTLLLLIAVVGVFSLTMPPNQERLIGTYGSKAALMLRSALGTGGCSIMLLVVAGCLILWFEADAIFKKKEPERERLQERPQPYIPREEREMEEPEPQISNEKRDEEPLFRPQTITKREKNKPKRKRLLPFTHSGKTPQLPPISLLSPPEKNGLSKVDTKRLEQQAMLLEEKLKNFGVHGKVVSIHSGPVVTMFEFKPSPGIKVSKIVNLADDIALSMKAQSVRVVAPIAGKGVVGIEVPNPKREEVSFAEIVSSHTFTEARSLLTLVMGKDIFGKPFVTDLSKMPHLLIGGSTGSGKSVGLNAMICSILFRCMPQQVKFIMVDPKMLEFSVYNGIPHLIAPVITDPRQAASALNWAVNEMERRYELLTQYGTRGIERYNEIAEDSLPYIVIVIDELADLMMVAGKEVETLIARLAQKARAAGIHLIVATQRPSVDVITGLIKANFPCRLSYKVISKVDSRTILDTMGAEKLLGAGDALFLPPGTSDLIRIHGAYISDEEIERVASFWRAQGEPQYDQEIISKPVVESGEGLDEEDELYQEAVELVIQQGHASASMIQRYLKIGYNRAARMIERMEAEGIVGPPQGSKPREVLANPRQ